MLAVTTNNSLKNNSIGIGRSRYLLGGSVVEVAVEAAGHYIVLVGSSRPKSSSIPVSYTHLTLPTILLV